MGCADGACKLTDCRNKLKRSTSTAAPDHYAVMGVAITASSSDVKQVSSSLASPLALVPFVSVRVAAAVAAAEGFDQPEHDPPSQPHISERQSWVFDRRAAGHAHHRCFSAVYCESLHMTRRCVCL